MVERITRRVFLTWIGCLSALCAVPERLGAANRDSLANPLNSHNGFGSPARSIGQRFAGERLAYKLSFLWFKKAATFYHQCNETEKERLTRLNIDRIEDGLRGQP